MKQRFSSIDVKVIAHELSKALVTLRVSNIYDLSSKIFLIKFAKPDHKQQIIIDSGFRCHLTEFTRATAATPSAFVTRLRKHLKTRRVTEVSQVGTDRIIEFQFSDGQYRLYLEFYASGNIILTDGDLKILALLRAVPEGEGQEELRVGLKYSLENRQNYAGIPQLTTERLQQALQKAADKESGGVAAGNKSKKAATDALRKALAVSINEFPPMLVDHAMRIQGFDATLKPSEVLKSEALMDSLLKSLEKAREVVQEITSSDITKGYIIAKKKDGYEGADQAGVRKYLIYDDFHPFRPRQFENDPATVFLEFDGFNKTADEFFSSIEGQKLESRLEERELAAQRKIQAARDDQAKRLGGLKEVQTLNERKAGALQANVERVQEAMDAVNGLIAQGMDWFEIGKLIEIEQKRNNPVASIIKLPLKLEENTITLLLDEEDNTQDDDSAYETDSSVSDSEDEAPNPEPKQKAVEKRLTIDIDLSLSPWANAREYFDQRKSAVEKEQKTMQSSTKALKSQEAKIAQDLKKGLKQEKAVLRPVRRQMWFEKFIWFVSSDGYLVLAGKDAQQNEILYKKYLKKGDVYVHADLNGAATVIIRNNPRTPDSPIPPSTLSQAGTMAVAYSSAWDSKAGMSAWWVNADQVSKSAPTGEFLPTGSFNVKGNKNFLPPAVLLLGFGVVFLISEESKAKHVKHRINDWESAIDRSEVTRTLPESVQAQEGIPELDDDQESENEDEVESDKEEEDIVPVNPLQATAKEPVISDDNEPAIKEPPIEELTDLKINDPTLQLGKPEAEGSSSEDDEDDLPPRSQPKTSRPTPPPPKTALAKRGKKGKAKKIASKYKYQDEEDRLLAQNLLGSTLGQEKAAEEAALKSAREAELAFQKERRRAQHQRTQKETAEHEALRKQMLESTPSSTHPTQEDEDGEEEGKLLQFENLVGYPIKGDEILEAIPVCAPWGAMSSYKYKAKLQPGTQKKGKAVKEILGRWMFDTGSKGKVDEKSEDRERMWPREVELLKGWRVEEVTNTVPVGKVRIMMAGGSGGGAAKAQNKGKGGSGRGSKKGR